jgi:hypothetical protein
VRRRALLATLLATLGAVALLQPVVSAGAVPPLVTGVAGLDDYGAATFAEVRATGATFVRIPVSWGGVAPEAPPAGWQPEDPADPGYEWGEVDAAVSGAMASGLTPMLLLEGAPRWAERCAPPHYAPGAVCDPDPAALGAFATALATRYSGAFQGLPRVRYWQGLNEPNLSQFFYPQFKGAAPRSPALYRELLDAFSDAVTGVNRSNVVVLGGLGPLAVPGFTVGPMRFLRELLCMRGRHRFRPLPGNCGGGVPFDVVDVHPYTTGGPTHRGGRDDVELGDLGKLRQLLNAAERAGRIEGRFRQVPLWVTEFAWDSNPPEPGGLAMRTLDRWTAEALHVAWQAGVSHFFWFPLRDRPRGGSFSQTLQGGLYFRGPTPGQDEPKEALRAFRFPFVAYPGPRGLAVWGRTPAGGPGRVSIQVLSGGRWRAVRTVRAGRSGVFEGVAATAYGRGRAGAVRALHRGEASLPFSMRPVGDFPQPPFG